MKRLEWSVQQKIVGIGGLLVVIPGDLTAQPETGMVCEPARTLSICNCDICWGLSSWAGHCRDWYLIDNVCLALSTEHSSSDNWLSQGWRRGSLEAGSWVRYTIVGRYIYDLITTTTTAATIDPSIQPLQIAPEMLYVVNSLVPRCLLWQCGLN